jgi:hypothetical protein
MKTRELYKTMTRKMILMAVAAFSLATGNTKADIGSTKDNEDRRFADGSSLTIDFALPEYQEVFHKWHDPKLGAYGVSEIFRNGISVEITYYQDWPFTNEQRHNRDKANGMDATPLKWKLGKDGDLRSEDNRWAIKDERDPDGNYTRSYAYTPLVLPLSESGYKEKGK